MRFSRAASGPVGSAVAASAITLALALAGCAHAPRRAEPTPDSPAPTPPRAPVPEGLRGGPESAEEQPPAIPPGRLDRSEEITPEELATIPDPVPGAGRARSAPQGETPSEAPSGAPEPGGVPNPSSGDSAAPEAPEGVWRVQIHASETRAEAERVGRAASIRLGVAFVIRREGSLYKVRLGAFANEQKAQALRDRAVGAGYSGAFRTRERP